MSVPLSVTVCNSASYLGNISSKVEASTFSAFFDAIGKYSGHLEKWLINDITYLFLEIVFGNAPLLLVLFLRNDTMAYRFSEWEVEFFLSFAIYMLRSYLHTHKFVYTFL